MTNHLPECIYTPEQFDPQRNIIWGNIPCICRALRACEQRVLNAARQVVETYAEERLIKTKHPNKSEDITAALRVAADRIMNMQKDMGQPPSLPPSIGVPERYLT